MDSSYFLSGDLGDYLYIIIFAILMLVGLFEKITKAKRPPVPPPTPQPDDDFEDVDEQPQTLEELMRRMMKTVEPQPETEPVSVSENSVKNYYTPITSEMNVTQFGNNSLFSQKNILLEEDTETGKALDFEFDIRQAVISNEILNRKY